MSEKINLDSPLGIEKLMSSGYGFKQTTSRLILFGVLDECRSPIDLIEEIDLLNKKDLVIALIVYATYADGYFKGNVFDLFSELIKQKPKTSKQIEKIMRDLSIDEEE